eukprot:TRINITY_DN11089_c0_g1_i11.p3 TRINITY_DN11089_c0_g1~~TRINITY_DN11089_c0_g1_i11.p3  ORF type:complete len:240 (+),score=-9.16 TRINITY_DN11089_c0_g1_i11:229-948(+)
MQLTTLNINKRMHKQTNEQINKVTCVYILTTFKNFYTNKLGYNAEVHTFFCYTIYLHVRSFSRCKLSQEQRKLITTQVFSFVTKTRREECTWKLPCSSKQILLLKFVCLVVFAKQTVGRSLQLESNVNLFFFSSLLNVYISFEHNFCKDYFVLCCQTRCQQCVYFKQVVAVQLKFNIDNNNICNYSATSYLCKQIFLYARLFFAKIIVNSISTQIFFFFLKFIHSPCFVFNNRSKQTKY